MTCRLPVNGYTNSAPSGYCAGPGGMSRYVRNLIFAKPIFAKRKIPWSDDEKPGQIYADRLSSVISVGIPHFEWKLSESRQPSSGADEGQRRLCVCLLENKILLLHD